MPVVNVHCMTDVCRVCGHLYCIKYTVYWDLFLHFSSIISLNCNLETQTYSSLIRQREFAKLNPTVHLWNKQKL